MKELHDEDTEELAHSGGVTGMVALVNRHRRSLLVDGCRVSVRNQIIIIYLHLLLFTAYAK